MRNVRHVYPNGYQALNDVSLTIEDGEVAAIIGRSDAGKSTLLRCISGMERAAAGSIAMPVRRRVPDWTGAGAVPLVTPCSRRMPVGR